MSQIGYQGWIPHPTETEAFARSLPPLYAEQASALQEDDDNEDRLAYRHLTALIERHDQGDRWLKDGRLNSRDQNPAGTCVGFGTATPMDVLAACDIAIRKEPERWVTTFSADWCYAASRHISNNLGRGDGSYGSAAAQAIREWGTILQLGELSGYDFERARLWARRGVPSSLRTEAGEHKVVHTARVVDADAAWSLVGNYYPFNMCSDIGWNNDRDSDGAIRRDGSWSHSMGVTSRRTTPGGRRLFLVHQSWGNNWTDGPYWEDQPLGSFWADFDDIDQAVRQGDTFAYSGYEGFVRRKPDHTVL